MIVPIVLAGIFVAMWGAVKIMDANIKSPDDSPIFPGFALLAAGIGLGGTGMY